jgi:hypothetical protein
MMTNKKISGLLPFHPFADPWPLMADDSDDFKDLVADIKANGMREQPVSYQDMILDGRNRARAAVAGGVPFSYMPFQGDDKKARALVKSANEHRRHQTREERRKALERLLKAHPEKSDRQIGKEAAVDKNTAAKARGELEARGESHHVEKREDTRGRKQPSSKRGKGKKSLNFVTAAEQAAARAAAEQYENPQERLLHREEAIATPAEQPATAPIEQNGNSPETAGATNVMTERVEPKTITGAPEDFDCALCGGTCKELYRGENGLPYCSPDCRDEGEAATPPAAEPSYMPQLRAMQGIFTGKYKSLGNDDRVGFAAATHSMIDEVAKSSG